MSKLPPKDLPGKLRFAGPPLYGEYWKAKLAEGLGISRSQLFHWLNGRFKSNRDIESDLIDLVEREHAASTTRGVELTALRRVMETASRRDRKQNAGEIA